MFELTSQNERQKEEISSLQNSCQLHLQKEQAQKEQIEKLESSLVDCKEKNNCLEQR